MNTEKPVLLFYQKNTTMGEIRINQKAEKCTPHYHLIDAAGEPCNSQLSIPSRRQFKMLPDDYNPPSETYKPID